MLGEADMDNALWAIELSARFEQIQSRSDLTDACRGAGRFVVAPPQPKPEARASNGPSLAVAIHENIGIRGPGRRVKQPLTRPISLSMSRRAARRIPRSLE